MKPIYLLCCLLGGTLLSSAQNKSEVSRWYPKNNVSSQLEKGGYTVTITDKEGLPAEVRDYYGDKLHERTEYTYNDKRQKVSETSYGPSGQKTLVKYFSYAENRQLEQMTYTYKNKADLPVTIKEVYAYDTAGRLFRVTNTSSRGFGDTRQYEYSRDENGNKVITEYKVGKRKNRLKVKSTYNAQNLILKEFKKNYQGSGNVLLTYEYTFNESGDWVTKKVYERRHVYAPRLITEYRKTWLD